MKKIFKYFGFLIIGIASLFYFENTIIAVKNIDEIMVQIKNRKLLFERQPVQAIVDAETIIPGICGYEIDVDASYKKMNYIGRYSDSYLEYKKIMPSQTLSNHIAKKIISGNNHIKQVSIILILNDLRYLEFIRNIDQNITIFIDGYIEDKLKTERSILKSALGTIGYSYNYTDSRYHQLDSKMKSISKKKNLYCLAKNIDETVICDKYNNYTIYSKIIVDNQLLNTKRSLQPGSILIYEVNDELIYEFSFIKNYIEMKGIDVVKLDQLLKE